jgi:methylmalonyl-CoA mutase N-terminal domain/subunit
LATSAIIRARDDTKVTAALVKLKQATQGTENLMPDLIETVKTYATLGEICDVLREVFGEYKAESEI